MPPLVANDHSESEDGDIIGSFQSDGLKRQGTWTGSNPKKTIKGITNRRILERKNTYAYLDIDAYHDIRILRVFPPSDDEKEKHTLEKERELRCMLFPSALHSARQLSSESKNERFKYEALSYWWGVDKPTHKITMYDGTGNEDHSTMHFDKPAGTFYVRDNLDDALRQLRKKDKHVDLWVDALCINQEKLQEKTAQVSRMQEVYSEAEHVWVWLGEGKGEKPKETIAFLKQILDLRALDGLIQDDRQREKWMLVVGLMRNRWFSRRWVIQELTLAKRATVRWGGAQIPWPNFAEAIALSMTKHSEIKGKLAKPKSFRDMATPNSHIGTIDPRALGANALVNATTNLFRKSEDGIVQQRLLNLEVLVCSLFLAFEASDRRDTIYAVLALAKDTAAKETLTARPSFEVATPFEKFLGWIAWLFCCFFRSLKKLLWKEKDVPPSLYSYSQHLDPRIAPDYNKSLTDACIDFMDYCIEHSRSLDIICRHWAPGSKIDKVAELKKENGKGQPEEEKLPSWIPSIEGHAFGGPAGVVAGRTNGDSLVGSLERQHKQYNASRDLRPCYEFRKCKSKPNIKTKKMDVPAKPNPHSPVGQLSFPDTVTAAMHQQVPSSSKKVPVPAPLPPPTPTKIYDGTLNVKGFELGTIEKMTGRVDGGVIGSEAFEWAGCSLDKLREKSLDEVPDALWRTLVADRGPDGDNAPTWYRRACLECLQHTTPTGDLNTKAFEDYEDTPSTMKMYLERVQVVIWRRRFFVTKEQTHRKKPVMYGLAPPKSLEGDIICILFGCSVPVVLRKRKEKGLKDRYEFIGECYVHGMMDGEAFTSTLPEYPYSRVPGFTLV